MERWATEQQQVENERDVNNECQEKKSAQELEYVLYSHPHLRSRRLPPLIELSTCFD